jgi:hypothetical protein
MSLNQVICLGAEVIEQADDYAAHHSAREPSGESECSACVGVIEQCAPTRAVGERCEFGLSTVAFLSHAGFVALVRALE